MKQNQQDRQTGIPGHNITGFIFNTAVSTRWHNIPICICSCSVQWLRYSQNKQWALLLLFQWVKALCKSSREKAAIHSWNHLLQDGLAEVAWAKPRRECFWGSQIQFQKYRGSRALAFLGFAWGPHPWCPLIIPFTLGHNLQCILSGFRVCYPARCKGHGVWIMSLLFTAVFLNLIKH